MNTKVYYHQTQFKHWENSVIELIEGIDRTKVISLTFFCEVSDNEYHNVLEKIRRIVFASIGKEVLVTLVPQLMAEKDTIVVEVYEQVYSSSRFKLKEFNHIHYLTFEDEMNTILLIEGIPSTDFSTSVLKQSEEIYGQLHAILKENNFEISDIVRQWNYIGDITGERNHYQNYQEYNNARSAFYRLTDWNKGYPAATGIGAATKGIIVSAIAVKVRGEGKDMIFPINNPLQIAAHTYSSSVLVGSNDTNCSKTTPKFERAKVVKTTIGDYCFVSGTAAIRGEKSSFSRSASDQIQQTIENVLYLVSDKNLDYNGCNVRKVRLSNLRVYIKNREDYDSIRQIVDKNFPTVPAVYLITEVCRTELLVEIEGICVIEK